MGGGSFGANRLARNMRENQVFVSAEASAPLSKCLTSRGIGSRARMLTLMFRPRGPSKLRSLSW